MRESIRHTLFVVVLVVVLAIVLDWECRRGQKQYKFNGQMASSRKHKDYGNELVIQAKKRSRLMLGTWVESNQYPDEKKVHPKSAQLVDMAILGDVSALRLFVQSVPPAEHVLLVHYANDKALRMAAKHHHWDCMFLLLSEYKANIHACSDRDDGLSLVSLKDAVIVHACYDGDAIVLQRLLSEFHRQPLCMDHAKEPTTTSEIDIVVEKGHVNALRCLLTHGVEENRPLRCINYTPEATKLPIVKLLWDQWRNNIREMDQKTEWTRLLKDVDDSLSCVVWVWTQCPEPLTLFDLSDMLRPALLYKYEHMSYPFIEFLFTKGALLTIKMLIDTMTTRSNGNVMPFFKWLSEQQPTFNWIHLDLFRKAHLQKQVELIKWISTMDTSEYIQRDFNLLKKKCSALLCPIVISDPESEGAMCHTCTNEIESSLRAYRAQLASVEK
jgi:hypothetical protein